MTLCAAWIREVDNNQELVFATDSCLGGGERWNSGIKLFELPRKDCVICFSGYTQRTYPLILNLINTLRYDKYASDTSYDINNLIHYITGVFTDIIQQIKLSGSQSLHDVLKIDPGFDFMFGGWSWKDSEFKLWRIFYSFDSNSFIPVADYDRLVFMWIGDEIDEAKQRLEAEIAKGGRILSGRLDMEPLSVLVQIIREPSVRFDTISGPIQLAKIYPPGRIETFGMYYPSIEGYKTFMGRSVSKINNPSVRFIDPDTGSIVDIDVPNRISVQEITDFGADADFIRDHYPDGNLKIGLSEKEKDMLANVIKDKAYKQFVRRLEDDLSDTLLTDDSNE